MYIGFNSRIYTLATPDHPKMKSFFKNITQRLTVPNNYNTEQIINPLKVFSTAGSEVVPVKQVTADVLKALDMAKVFL